MSKYTFELRELFEPIKFNPPLYTREQIEGWFKDYQLTDYLTQDQIDVINHGGIWNKDKLARKIVDHYYMRESGLETIGLFKHYAKTVMQELMEEYLPLIYSASIEYDPLINVDYTETFGRTIANTGSNNSTSNNNSSGSSSSSSTNTGSSLNIESDTPQGQITKTDILAGNYATKTSANENTSSITDTTTTENTSNNTGSMNTTNNTNEQYSKAVKGNSGVSATAQKMILQYRENIVAIDRKIIKELNILFMGLY